MTLNPEDRETERIDNEDDDDDIPQLSSNALAALQEFLQERQAQEQEEEEEQIAAAAGSFSTEKELRHVTEDWQLSQFWYTDATAAALAQEALTAAGDRGRVACVSCPTLYKAIVDSVKAEEATASTFSTSDPASPSSSRAVVLEYDRRFSKWGVDFVFYDYKDASVPDLPAEWRHAFDVVVCDPPFLTEDCAAATLRAAIDTLGKQPATAASDEASTEMCKIMFCTGEIMAEKLTELSGGRLKKSETFVPEHASKLSNPFVLLTNFETTTL